MNDKDVLYVCYSEFSVYRVCAIIPNSPKWKTFSPPLTLTHFDIFFILSLLVIFKAQNLLWPLVSHESCIAYDFVKDKVLKDERNWMCRIAWLHTEANDDLNLDEKRLYLKYTAAVMKSREWDLNEWRWSDVRRSLIKAVSRWNCLYKSKHLFPPMMNGKTNCMSPLHYCQ